MRCLVSLVLGVLLAPVPATGVEVPALATGIKIGEVRHDSAIVWTRTSAGPRVDDGVRLVGNVPRPADENPILSLEEVNRLEGAVPGAAGEVRYEWSTDAEFGDARRSNWRAVDADRDFTDQFTLTELQPATRYHVRVSARPAGGDAATASVTGTFQTPATAAQWQDVTFAVITGQAYKDLDDPAGYHIYPAMQSLGIDFLVPTGDTVYYDNEAPRARNVAMARYHWHRIYSLPRLVEFHRHVPAYWEKDDHDTLSDDAFPSMHPKFMLPLTWDEGLAIFREQVPMGEKTFRTIRWGRGLQVWLVEGRDFRSANNAPDGPDKTIWGREQRDWLTRSILESDADFRVLVSPTPIVGPDRPNKRDNHANPAFQHEGDWFRNWTRAQGLKNFLVCCGDRHWQYHSVHPETGLHEFCSGAVSDPHAGGTPGHDMMVQPFHRVKGGFLTVSLTRGDDNLPRLTCRHHDVHGKVVYQFEFPVGE